MPEPLENMESEFTVMGTIPNVDFGYKYPKKLDLRPQSELHGKIIAQVRRRAQDSFESIQPRYESWQRIDKVLSTFVSKQEIRNAKTMGDQTMPIIIPTSFATLETLLTYMTAAFLQDPYYKYKGTGPEDSMGAELLQHVINVQAHKMKHGLNLHTLWRDAFSYGFGAISVSWHKHMGYRRRKAKKSRLSFTGLFDTQSTAISKVWTTLYEGNRLNNIDPYFYLPDPSVAVQDVQRGEYVGWVDRISLTDLLSMEEEPGSLFFNAKYVKGIDGRTSLYRHAYTTNQSYGTDNTNLPRHSRRDFNRRDISRPVDLTYMYINLIPKDWGLGKEEYPRKWMFTVAGDAIVIAAQPLNLDHNMYPVVVAAPDYDGYSVAPISRMEIGYGTQHIIDWMFSSHIANVRKIINDTLIVDPFLLNMNDFKTGQPGGIIRTRRANWGKGTSNLIEQLKVTDVTRGHMADAAILTDIHNKSTGATDIISGVMRSGGERRSATEARGASQAALSKLEKAARIMSMQYHGDLAYMNAAHTQQLMSEDVFVEIIGELSEELLKERGMETANGNVRVAPMDMILDYDVIPNDGTIPGKEPPDVWVELFRIIHDSPIVGQQFDIPKVFAHVARQLGAKNIQEFIKKGGNVQAQVVPDDQALEAAETTGAG